MSSPSDGHYCRLEDGNCKAIATGKDIRPFTRTARRMSSSSLRKKSEVALVKKMPDGTVRKILINMQEVILGTKLSVLFPAVFLSIAAHSFSFATPWVFVLSLAGLIPLAERVSFLTEQIAYFTGPTVGGLLNATCGNATELIIAVLALRDNKIIVVKYSLLGSILSNLLLVLGTSLFCGGIVNLNCEQKFNRKQADVNSLLLLLSLLCQSLPMIMIRSTSATAQTSLLLSRASSAVMLTAYIAYLIFQLVTHKQLFEADDDGEAGGDEAATEGAVMGFWVGFCWLLGMTAIIALLSEYVVETIEDASSSWGVSVSFIGIILLPIVGNAAEHAGAIIFAFKNKLDISLGVALGSATQIAMFVVPFSVTLGWMMGIRMDLNFGVLETACLAMSMLVTSFTLQDGSSHYMKGLVLLLCYVVISACFFVLN